MFDLQEELKKLPAKPGVYLMHNKKDEIIYVGKAISLKNRVRQYFQASRNVTQKIARMIEQIAYFEYIITDSELEALVLECNLIKEYNPKYNTMLKDGKSYPYIKATIQEEYPRLLFSRNMKKDKSKYFGPYTSAGAVKDTLELIRKIFFVRSCNKSLPKEIGKGRPCLYYDMKKCKAPCQDYISREEYQANFQKAIEFLNGNYSDVEKMLEEKMKKAAEEFEFEEAAEYRDLIASVKHITQKQKINRNEYEDRDIIALAKAEDDAVVQVFFIRDGKLIGREHYYLSNVEQEERPQILSDFIKQYYSGTPFIPKELTLEENINEEEIILEWLSMKRGQKVHISVPKRGEKERLVELARKNASLILQQDAEKIKREELKTRGAMNQIGEWLDLPGLKRVESFDISNMNGFETVGSMVVYEDGKPRKNDYRKFKIKSVTGPDDYHAMEEMLTRRFLHGLREREEEASSFQKFPDLIMMDGGKGQVNVALKVLDQLRLNIPVCGMVKDDNHRTRGLYFNNIEIPIDKSSEGFHLITRIQDETHRFAIEYHRSLRGKTQVHSILDDINGVGDKRRRALMKYFKSFETIKEASVEELKQVPTMNELSAKKVYEFFHKTEENED